MLFIKYVNSTSVETHELVFNAQVSTILNNEVLSLVIHAGHEGSDIVEYVIFFLQ